MPELEDDLWGLYEAECQACDVVGQVNDLMLCQNCAEKFDRDMIRQRDWAYSSDAFCLSTDGREKLYQQIISEYGKEYQLIAPPEKSSQRSKKENRRLC